MEPKTKRLLAVGGVALGAVAVLLLVSNTSSAEEPKKVPPAPPKPQEPPSQPPQPPSEPVRPPTPSEPPRPSQPPAQTTCTTWRPSTSDPDAVFTANNLPVPWVAGTTYGPVTINGRQWRFRMYRMQNGGQGVIAEVCTSP